MNRNLWVRSSGDVKNISAIPRRQEMMNKYVEISMSDAMKKAEGGASS